jgi:addiction module HigA family antidote
MAERLAPITLGDILRDEFMAEYGLSQNRLALALHVPVSIINRVVNNKYRITAELALRLAVYFGTSAQFWMNLQTSYDLRMAERKSGAKVKQEIQPVQPEPMA